MKRILRNNFKFLTLFILSFLLIFSSFTFAFAKPIGSKTPMEITNVGNDDNVPIERGIRGPLNTNLIKL